MRPASFLVMCLAVGLAVAAPKPKPKPSVVVVDPVAPVVPVSVPAVTSYSYAATTPLVYSYSSWPAFYSYDTLGYGYNYPYLLYR